MSKVVVTVMPREGVLDPQGQAVRGALVRLGFEGVGDVRVGKRIEIQLDADEPVAVAQEMVDRLLANPLVEDAHVEVDAA
jgi:phosphoribosylformylglycinamidine synthase PurS subunit